MFPLGKRTAPIDYRLMAWAIFSDPNGSFGSSSFGQITSTRIGPRNVQLGMKYYF